MNKPDQIVKGFFTVCEEFSSNPPTATQISELLWGLAAVSGVLIGSQGKNDHDPLIDKYLELLRRNARKADDAFAAIADPPRPH